MSLKKQLLRSKPVCKVTFRFPKEMAGHATSVVLAGDFNNWDTAACQLTKLKSGEFTVLLELEKDKEYEFRYLVDGKDWYNDPEADRYTANPFGGENSVVVAGVFE